MTVLISAYIDPLTAAAQKAVEEKRRGDPVRLRSV